jgi:hypothetical protein
MRGPYKRAAADRQSLRLGWKSGFVPRPLVWEDAQRVTLWHTVADYNSWRKVFDEFQPAGAEHGARSAAVYQAPDNPRGLRPSDETRLIL